VSMVATSSLVGLGSLSLSSISRLFAFVMCLPEFENSGSCAGTLLIISIVILFSLNASTLSTRCRECYLSSVLEAKSNIHNITNRWVYHISSFPTPPSSSHLTTHHCDRKIRKLPELFSISPFPWTRTVPIPTHYSLPHMYIHVFHYTLYLQFLKPKGSPTNITFTCPPLPPLLSLSAIPKTLQT
jgi:hypothetical protein